MAHFRERGLTGELSTAKNLLQQALAILDAHGENAAAYCVCEKIERLIGAPSTVEQWHLMTGRNAYGSSP